MAGLALLVLLLLSAAIVEHSLSFEIAGQAKVVRGLYMGNSPKPQGIATTKLGKAAVLERTKRLLSNTSMLAVAPVQGVTKEQVDSLRKTLPSGTTASVIKNALLKISVQGTAFESIIPVLKEENIFFFMPEDTAKATYEGFTTWRRDITRTDAKFDLKAIALEGERFEGTMIEKVANLPSKKLLMAKLAQALQGVPLRLARSVKAIPKRVGNAVRAVHRVQEKQAEASAGLPS